MSLAFLSATHALDLRQTSDHSARYNGQHSPDQSTVIPRTAAERKLALRLSAAGQRTARHTLDEQYVTLLLYGQGLHSEAVFDGAVSPRTPIDQCHFLLQDSAQVTLVGFTAENRGELQLVEHYFGAVSC